MANKIIRFNFCFLIFLVSCLNIHAQTNVSGGIFTNTTWTMANSPYIVTDTVVVFPGATLTIEPGVVVKFMDNMGLQIRQATLIAEGTATDSITFTSNSPSPTAGIYTGISFDLAITPVIKYCNYYYANSALDGSLNDSIIVENSNFEFNNRCFRYISGILGHSHVRNTVCNFNNVAFDVSSIRVSNSTISNNQIAFGYCGYSTIKNCIIDSNVLGIQTYQELTIQNNELKYNQTAIEIWQFPNTPILITQNVIESNDVGILVSSEPYQTSIYCNKICSNNLYDVKNSISQNLNVFENNYWCSTDSSIIAGHIYDGYDNASVGLLDFVPFDTTGCYLTGCNLILTTLVSNATCDTCHNGGASVNVTNGFQPITITWNSSPIQTGQSASGLAPGNYSVCVSDGQGCTSCTSVFIDSTNCTGYSIHAIPVSSTCSACNDGMAYAVINGGTYPYSYTWYSSPVQNSDTAIGLPSGSYAVCISDLHGCLDCDTFLVTTGNCSAHFNLFPDTIPHHYFAVNMASGTSPLNYSWNWGDGSPIDTGVFPNHTYAVSGLYNICLTIIDSVGCTNTYCNSYFLLRQTESATMVSVNVVPSLPTSVDNISEVKDVYIYPNPTTNGFTIKNIPKVAKTNASIINPFGSIIYEKENLEGDVQMDITLKPGVYYVVIHSPKGSQMLYLMIQ
jgi:hypothetical protein